MATVSELRQQAKARKIPKYSKMNKSQLMGALGVTAQSARPLGDARARSTAKQHGIAKTYAADKLSSKLGGSDEAKRVAIKQRIVKSVSKELKAHEKKIGRKLTIEEKRSVAVKALASEVRAIRSGKLSSDEIRTARTANIKRLQKEGKLPQSQLSKDEIRTARELNLKRLQKEKAKADKFVPQHEQETIAAKADSKAKKGKKTAAEILAKNRADHLADPKSQELMMNFRAHAERTRAARKAEQEAVAAKAPKHGSAPFKRRKGGALASVGDRMERTEKNEPKNESKQAEAKEKKLKPQEAIDHKHSSPSPTEAHVDGWLKDTALRVGKPAAKKILFDTIGLVGGTGRFNLENAKTLDQTIAVVHAKLKESKPGATLADAKKIVDKAHKATIERLSKTYKAIQDGDKATIERVGRSEAYKLPGLASDHRSTIKEHLIRTFSKNGGDSKALGLEPGKDFTVGELKTAYRSASLKAHPDRGGSPEKFQALKESYDRMMPKAKSPALDKVAADTGMTREEVAKAVKRRKAKAEPSAKKAPSEEKPWHRKLTRKEIAKKRKEDEKIRKIRTDGFFDETAHQGIGF